MAVSFVVKEMNEEKIKELFNTDKEIHEYVSKYATSQNITTDEALGHMIVQITIAWMVKQK